MAQEIKDLIAKIQKEGVEEAEKQAGQVMAQAELSAEKIVADAKAQARKIIEEADSEAGKIRASTEASLKQAGRDTLISLRKEINSMLESLLKFNVSRVLTAEELAGIIKDLIKASPLSLGSQIIVSLSPQDKEKLEKEFLRQLKEETKKQVVLKSAQEIDSGFIISFDSGKSSFDFSSQALADYISGSLRPELNKILKSV
jgi:V/A-type H+-transporting ATPase subunit E